MLVFNFQFNPPKPKKILAGHADFIFQSFVFQPSHSYEKKLGYLYIVGSLKNILPKHHRFLEILAQKIKNEYYQSLANTPEKSLQQAIKIANEHLAKIAKEGDVSWLGNLSVAIISLIPQENHNIKINFTKVGEVKLVLLREGQLIDIDQQLKFQEIEPYPLKIFGSFASGQLSEGDIILASNPSVYATLLTENLINEIAHNAATILNTEPLKKNGFERWLINLFNNAKDKFTNLKGVCLLIALTKKEIKQKKEILLKDPWLQHLFKKFQFKHQLSSLKSPKQSGKLSWFSRLNLLIWLKLKLLKIRNIINQNRLLKSKKQILITLCLLLFLLIGYFYFQKKEELKIQTYQNKITQIQKEINEAEAYFVMADYTSSAKKNAQQLYEKIWNEISNLIKTSPSESIAQQLNDLKQTIKPNLYQLNKLVEINNPLPVFEFKAKEFVPEKLLFYKNKIYFLNPYSEDIFVLTEQNQPETIKTGQKIHLMALSDNRLFFFAPPNQILILSDNQLSEPISIANSPLSESNFNEFSLYDSHLYFLDKKNNSIIKYPLITEKKWNKPLISLQAKDKPDFTYQSMAIDGSIWLLTTNNVIEKYYAGQYQKSINLEIFPPVKNLSKIFTNPSLSYLYLLEPAQKRIIILNKNGELIKQYQSEIFDNLLDFTVSNNGQTLWLLNGLKLYRLDNLQ